MSALLDCTTELLDWLESGRQKLLALAAARSLPTSVAVSVLEVDFTDLRTWSARTAIRTVSPLAADLLAPDSPPSGHWLDARSRTAAAALHEAFGERVKYWTGGGIGGLCALTRTFSQTDFDDQPERWIEEYLLLKLLSAYLVSIPDLAAGDLGLAARLVSDMVAFAEREQFSLRSVVPVSGCELGTRVEEGCVSLAPLTAEESGSFLPPFPRRYWGRPLVEPDPPWATPPTHLLTVEEQVAKDEPPRPSRLPDRLVLAFRLLDLHLAGPGFLRYWVEPAWLSPLRMTRRMLIGTEPLELQAYTPGLLAEAIDLAQRMPEGAISGPNDRRKVAIHRFMLAESRNDPVEEVLNYTVALETVLLPAQKEQELRFRFALLGARYTSDEQGERQDLFRAFRDLYDLRSRLVHAQTSFPTANETRAGAIRARELARRVLRKALMEGWPTDGELQELVLN